MLIQSLFYCVSQLGYSKTLIISLLGLLIALQCMINIIVGTENKKPSTHRAQAPAFLKFRELWHSMKENGPKFVWNRYSLVRVCKVILPLKTYYTYPLSATWFEIRYCRYRIQINPIYLCIVLAFPLTKINIDIVEMIQIRYDFTSDSGTLFYENT